MKAKFFPFYLRFRKPIILVLALIASVIVGLDKWQRYKYKTADYTPWTLVTVDSGSSFTVARHHETKTVNLCGVAAIEDESKKYLQSVINLGDGTVELEKVGDRYEAWISLARNYDVELVKHISAKSNELVEQEIHLNTWLLERGLARRDLQKASQCKEPEHLAWAEKLAQQDQLGIWHSQ